jgi:predicted enzyme involved in methoxymalonyl-ACP biosynthesis
MKRFPDNKDALRQMYRASKSFQSICQNYQKCSEALNYWAESEDENAPEREKEYSELLQELELEITISLENSP